MPEFAYVARNLKGEKVTGKVNAASEREALSSLSTQSLFPLQVKAGTNAAAKSSRRVKGQVMSQVYAQLSALLRSGVPLLRSIAVLRDQTTNSTLKFVLDDIYSKIEDGVPMAEAMSRHPKAFSEMAVNMARAGSEGGFLEDALERVSTFTEQQEDLKSRTMGALAYPIVLSCIGTVVVSSLIIFFVPQFAPLFGRLRSRGELPLATEVLLWISGSLKSWLPGLAVVAVILIFVIKKQLETEKGRAVRDRLKLKIPLAGKIFQSLAVARFCRVLGTLLKNGVPILKSLEISREAAGNRMLSAAIEQASENISSGESLAAPLAASKQFPRTVVEMISVAEESNSLDKVLVDVADGLERRTTRQLDLMVRLLEPLMLLVMAGIVLLVVIALLLPIMKMSSSL